MGSEDTLRERIAAHGPISIADYMAVALGDSQYGYYMRKDPFGTQGDFITSPEISQIFGEMIGIWCAECWLQLGRPEMDVIELGPGRGTLMKDWLRATRHIPQFHDCITVHLVETSPALRAIQQETLASNPSRLYWHFSLPDTNRPLLVYSNEFFDALPIHQYITQNGAWHERLVDWHNGRFCFTIAEDAASLPAYPTMEDGVIVEQCPLAKEIMQELSGRVAAYDGAILSIDYGYTRPENGALPVGDTLQAVYKHTYHDVLSRPGEADITAHVDFSALAENAATAGARAAPVISQRDFLLRMGAEMRVQQLCRNLAPEQKQRIEDGFQRLVDPQGMGSLFKVLAVTSPQLAAPVFE